MFRFLFSLAVLCCCLTGVAFAKGRLVPPPDLSIQSAHIGIENTYKNGLWTPITLESPVPIETLAIRCSDSDGTPITYRYDELCAPQAERLTVLAKMGRKDEPIQISVNGGKYKSFNVPPPVNAERPIYLIFGNEDIGLQGAVAELMLREDRRPLLVKVNSFTDLPTDWFGYEAVEMVVLTTTEPAIFDGLTAESPQIQALNDWLKLGGKMLLCAGKDAEQFLDDEDGFLHIFLPGKYDGMTELRLGTSFERFVNSQRQIFMNGTEEAPFMKMPRILEPSGMTIVKDGDLPLIIRSAHGLGTIIYFGGDLSGRPLNNWRDRTTLVRNIMQWNTVSRSASGAMGVRAGAMLQLGYNDIAGQIRSALDQFEGVRIVPFSVILIILTAYWLVIGLFDWFFVHKILKKPILTWITFPLWIVLFSVLTYVLAAPGRPGEEKYNQLYIADTDYEHDVLRLSIWNSVYSSTDRLVDLEQLFFDDPHPLLFSEALKPSPWYKSGSFSWNGLSGSGLGGMAPKTVSTSVWQVGSEQNEFCRLNSVPIQTRSTKSFFGQHHFSIRDGYRIHSQLTDDEGVPIGTVVFPDKEDFSLQNCILVYGRWALELGDIVPGQTITVTKTTPRREMRDLLMPPQTLDNESVRRLATYNPQSVDLEYIVRVMTLHRALGGYESTGLHHAYQSSLDMSDLLTVDRALLLGAAAGGDNSSTIIFRASLPITILERSRRYESGTGVLDSAPTTDYVDPNTPVVPR